MRNAPERRRPYVSSKLLPYPMPRDSPDHWLTKYQKTYFEKPVQPVSTPPTSHNVQTGAWCT